MNACRVVACCALTLFLELCSNVVSAQKIFSLENEESYYSTGYYYLPDSTKKSGLIKYTFRVPGSFRFKDSLTAKAITVTADECIGFHEDGDKADFQTLSNVKLPGELVGTKVSKCFAELRISGELCLYLVYYEKNRSRATFVGASGFGGSIGSNPQREATSVYVLKKKNSEVVQEVPKRAKPFKKELTAFLADKPGIVEFINSHDYTAEDIEMVVQAYNYSK
ncbi:hypothetical protein [Chitinophaga varians]|uniref:hypothetical protein n=1 Tax=Chitinophaga varians TaxID=2202339 RepID=UPI00165F0144|nr:hypothetical protein [Chitinophaga varians]MBC9909000.1 hypothetical protein [Chitinophaga varians]